ncbi:hypothetical protein BS78_08G081500 [Paspalum vaginatum]|nr:hypothetical protein BS78_08G081500 [Paspalum vaginatum]
MASALMRRGHGVRFTQLQPARPRARPLHPPTLPLSPPGSLRAVAAPPPPSPAPSSPRAGAAAMASASPSHSWLAPHRRLALVRGRSTALPLCPPGSLSTVAHALAAAPAHRPHPHRRCAVLRCIACAEQLRARAAHTAPAASPCAAPTPTTLTAPSVTRTASASAAGHPQASYRRHGPYQWIAAPASSSPGRCTRTPWRSHIGADAMATARGQARH